jgi:hypothetical protein
MRAIYATIAAGLAAIATTVASLDGHADFVPFYAALTLAGGVVAGAAHEPFEGTRRQVARLVAAAWVVAAIWVAVLLGLSITSWASSPPPVPSATFVGIPAPAFYVTALFGGAVLIGLAVARRPATSRFAAAADSAPS